MGMCQKAPAVVNDVGWMTRSEGSMSTRRRESHNNGLPYDDHVMSRWGSPMYFEEIKRRPSKMGEQQQLRNKKRDKSDMREKPLKVKWTERKIPNDQKEENMTHEEKRMIICYRWPRRTCDNKRCRKDETGPSEEEQVGVIRWHLLTLTPPPSRRKWLTKAPTPPFGEADGATITTLEGKWKREQTT